MERIVLDRTKIEKARQSNENVIALVSNLEKVAVVRVTKNYGVEAIYPANEAAETFAKLAGTKTLTRHTIRLIKELGYRVDVEPEEIAF